MSAYRIATNSREVRLMSAGVNRGARIAMMIAARTSPAHLRSVFAKAARANNHDMVRDIRAAKEAM